MSTNYTGLQEITTFSGVCVTGGLRAEKGALFFAEGGPGEVALGVSACGFSDRGAEAGVVDQSSDGGGEGLGGVGDPDAVLMEESEAGTAGGGGDYCAAHRHSFENLHVCPGGDGGGDDHEVGFDIERADVGDEAE